MISGVVLARNEAANIVDCLSSLCSHVNEIILIDMESTDETVSLAGPFATQILHHPLIANFDSARNIAVPAARYDWIWFLDADERIPMETGRLVNQLVREHGHDVTAITIPFKTYFAGKWIEHCGWWPGYTMPRVLKRGFFRFRDEIHSGVETKGRELRIAARSELAIEHLSYRSVEHYIEKLNRYTSTEAANRSSRGAKPDWQRGIREMVRDLWLYYERNAGAQDGYHGWVLSWLSGQYRWLAEAKLLDLSDQRNGLAQIAVPSNLDEVLQVAQQELATLRGTRPKLPLPVLFRSPLLDPSGYADDGRCLLKALSLTDRKIIASEIRWSEQRVGLSPADAGLINTLLRTSADQQGIVITNCIPTLCEPSPHARINVLRTTFETDRLPPAWVNRLEDYDEIWVCSEDNRRSFRRSGAAPERIHVIPQAIDSTMFCPEGSRFSLPESLTSRFIFLSILDWQLRKGWDVLLRAYCREFAADEGTGLLLKITRAHGYPLDVVLAQANEVLRELGLSLDTRPDIVIWDVLLDSSDLAAVYRSASAFVLASRGEGWGRPYLEALASGLPVIATTGSGHDDFLNDTNSFRVETQLAPVSPNAARELSIYAGHSWHEPDEAMLRRMLRLVRQDTLLAKQKAMQGVRDARERHSVPALTQVLSQRLCAVDALFTEPTPPPLGANQIRVVLEGELFASHSFSNINEQIALRLRDDPLIALSLNRLVNHPTSDQKHALLPHLAPLFHRTLPDVPEITIRHAFPPNWTRPPSGKWVHIQPWEFGHLPKQWVGPLRDDVDEIWVPSNYVQDVYVRSGIPREKIHVIPWGIDPDVYRPDIPDRILPISKGFRFLYVGGTIPRKGFDLVLDGYLDEFTQSDDVCLVVKDMGTKTFYRHGNLRDRVLQAQSDPSAPPIVYFDTDLTDGQRASLYVACDCLVAPYRGEGFGLPVLEAMACGLTAIVPRGGPTDDFCLDRSTYFLPSRTVECPHDWELCGPPTELAVDGANIRRAMRRAFSNPNTNRINGVAASEHVRRHFCWQSAVQKMSERIRHLAAAGSGKLSVPSFSVTGSEETLKPVRLPAMDLSACLVAYNCERTLSACLAHVTPFSREVIVGDLGCTDRTVSIAKEYGARVIDLQNCDPSTARARLLQVVMSAWAMILDADDFVDETTWEKVLKVIAANLCDRVEVKVENARRRGQAKTLWLVKAPIRNGDAESEPW